MAEATNKIIIEYETKGVDKTSKDTQTLSKHMLDLSKSSENIKKAYNATYKELEKTSKQNKDIASSLARASKETKINNDAIKASRLSLNSLTKVVNDNIKVRDTLTNEALKKESASLYDVIAVNEKYLESLAEEDKALTGVIAKTEEQTKAQGSLSKAIKEGETRQSNLNKLLARSNVSLKDVSEALNKAEDVTLDTTKTIKQMTAATKEGRLAVEAFKDQLGGIPVIGRTLGRSLDGVNGNILSIAKSVAPIAGVGVAFAAVGTSIKLAYDNSEKMQKSMANIKEYSSTVVTPLKKAFESLGDTITNSLLKPLETEFRIAYAKSGEEAKKNAKLIEEAEKAKAEVTKEYEAEKARIREVYANDRKKINEEIVNAEKTFYDNLAKLANDNTKILNEKEKKDADRLKQLQADENKRYENLKRLKETQDKISKGLMQDSGIGIDMRVAQAQAAYDNAAGALKEYTTTHNQLISSIANANKEMSDATQNSIAIEKKQFEVSLSVAKAKEKTLAQLLKENEKYNIANVEIDKKYSGLKKADLDKELSEGLINRREYAKKLKDLAKESGDIEKETKLKSLQNFRSLYESEMQKQIGTGKDAQKIMVNAFDESGKLVKKNILDVLADYDAQIKKMQDDAKEATKSWTEELKESAPDIVNGLGALAQSSMSLFQAFQKSNLEDLKTYEKAMDTAQNEMTNKLKEFDDRRNKEKEEAEKAEKERQEADRQKQREEEDSDREERIAKLQAEYDRSIESQDQMSAKAIDIKIRQLQKEQQAEDKKRAEEDKKRAEEEKKKEEEAKKDKERKRIAAEGEYNLAMATYNKDMAEYHNNIKAAEQEKSKAVADAALGITQSIANAAMMPLLPGWAGLGPPGIIAASIAAAASLGGALASLGNINSAASNLDSVKGNAPTPPSPPQFAYGTGGYALKASEYAIVGEQGPEMVRQRADGGLEVVSTERTKNMNNSQGDTIINIVINVQEMIDKNTLAQYIRDLKDRDFAYALQ